MKRCSKPTLIALAVAAVFSGSAGAQTFTDVSVESGFASAGNNASWGMGWADVDRDGDPDAFTYAHLPDVTGSIGAQFWRNNGDGTFTDETAAAGFMNDTGDTHGVAFGDINADGFPDMHLVNGSVKSDPLHYDKMWLNSGTGTFTDIATSAGLLGVEARGRGVYTFDANRDGKLDLFVTRFDRPDTKPFDQDLGNQLFINNGNNTFTETGVAAGIDRSLAENRAAGWADYDGDGIIDLLVTGPCVLWKGNADGTYADVTVAAGIEASDECTSVGWADYDRDGDIDLFISRGFDAAKSDALYRNNNNGTFTDVTTTAGISGTFLKRGVTWGDYDNDGNLDLYVVALNNGSTANLLYRNKGDGTFENVSVAEGAEGKGAGNGSAATFVDYDVDGDLDLFIANGEGNAVGPYMLLRNGGNANNWLNVRLIGKTGNIEGLGTKVKVESTATGVQYQHHLGPQHFLSQSLLPLHVGLGTDTGVTRMTFTWPSGTIQRVENVAAGQNITLVEGKAIWQDSGVISGVGYHIWQSGKRWKIVFKGDAAKIAFTGTVTSPAAITNLVKTGLETDDVITLAARKIDFVVNDDGKGIDTIDFETTANTLTFDIKQNGVASPQTVHLGKYKVKPATLPMTLKR